MNYIKFTFLSFLILNLFSSLIYAEEIIEPKPPVEEPINTEVKEIKIENSYENTNIFKAETSQDLRKNPGTFVNGSYSPYDLIIPSKWGLSLGYNKDNNNQYELEYIVGTIAVPFIIDDLGKMSDSRISLIKRSYLGSNSFNISYGLSYFDFNLVLGDKLLNSLSSGVYPAVDVASVKSIGFNVGLGNRWQYNKNLILGVDWFSWSQPLHLIKKEAPFLDYSTNESDKKTVSDALNLIAYFPRLAIIKLQIGWLF